MEGGGGISPEPDMQPSPAPNLPRITHTPPEATHSSKAEDVSSPPFTPPHPSKKYKNTKRTHTNGRQCPMPSTAEPQRPQDINTNYQATREQTSARLSSTIPDHREQNPDRGSSYRFAPQLPSPLPPPPSTQGHAGRTPFPHSTCRQSHNASKYAHRYNHCNDRPRALIVKFSSLEPLLPTVSAELRSCS